MNPAMLLLSMACTVLGQCPSSHPHLCRSASDVNKRGCPTCEARMFQGPCCDKNADCVCDDYCGPGCSGGGAPIPWASDRCPSTHPYLCESAHDVNRANCPTCQAHMFQGPCCDKNPDCVCDKYCGPGCNDGAVSILPAPSSSNSSSGSAALMGVAIALGVVALAALLGIAIAFKRRPTQVPQASDWSVVGRASTIPTQPQAPVPVGIAMSQPVAVAQPAAGLPFAQPAVAMPDTPWAMAHPIAMDQPALAVTQPSMSFVEKVELLKVELGLRGNMKDVVEQAAVQLGVQSAGQPLTAVAAMCVNAIGGGPGPVKL